MQWEYYRLSTVETNMDDALLDLGKEGWELVSIMAETRLFHGFQCVFKRPATGAETPRRGQPPVPHRFNKFVSVR